MPIADGIADGPAPAVSTLNGKLSTEGSVQINGTAGTAFNAVFGGGTAHLFWRDPAIGLFGPFASVQAGSGVRAGWYGAEAELYAGIFTFGAWGGHHDVVDNRVGITANSGF